MRLFLIGILISFNLFAATEGADVCEGTTYKLTQNFQLPQTGERSGSILDFSKGESFTLQEIMPLPIGFPLIAYIFKYNNCPGYQIEADVELVTVESSGVVVGAALDKCELTVYVEGQDYYSSSLFE